ncbi:hypothetical protein [Parasitella parasitica]|uniref:Uncharacterized protein n=1 Tax=Parasitella parasitica TaxID=35722 RepID=A0A0B7ND72_9FUNG|nr:hypothetical protein [Parasitella parasitica]
MLSYYNKFWNGKIGRISSLNKTTTPSTSTLQQLPDDDSEKLKNDLGMILSSLSKDQGSNQTNKQEADAGYSLQEALYGLIEKIQQATQRSLDNQRVDPSARLQRQLDVASFGALVDRMNKRRFVGQEWISNSEQLSIDIAELVAKSSCFFRVEDEYEDQRYELSPIKERDLYLFHIFSKINRQSARRMANQDAEIKPRKSFEDEEDDDLFSLIHKASSSNAKFADQRATMKLCP